MRMTLQKLAKILGYAGLIPFFVFSIATWVSLPLAINPHFVLTAYAAVILSFMGAIHWGIAMTEQSAIANRELSLSVVPALLGWLALLMPSLFGYGLLILCFALLYMADSYTNRQGLLPVWYLPMRMVLTTVVVLCLAVAALALVVA